mgnify:CR=1 FL=1
MTSFIQHALYRATQLSIFEECNCLKTCLYQYHVLDLFKFIHNNRVFTSIRHISQQTCLLPSDRLMNETLMVEILPDSVWHYCGSFKMQM